MLGIDAGGPSGPSGSVFEDTADNRDLGDDFDENGGDSLNGVLGGLAQEVIVLQGLTANDFLQFDSAEAAELLL
jgi:hypothetical protein